MRLNQKQAQSALLTIVAELSHTSVGPEKGSSHEAFPEPACFTYLLFF